MLLPKGLSNLQVTTAESDIRSVLAVSHLITENGKFFFVTHGTEHHVQECMCNCFTHVSEHLVHDLEMICDVSQW